MSRASSWLVRLPDNEGSARAFDELVERSRQLVHEHFPASCGYEAQGVTLTGPIGGVTWKITRGTFIAEVGLHRFLRAGSHSGPQRIELRLVASARAGGGGPLDPRTMEQRVLAWGLAWGSASLLLWGALVLVAGGALGFAAQLALAAPILVISRTAMAALAARASGTPRALIGARDAAALPPPAPQQHDGLRRWARLIPALQAQQRWLQRPAGLPPFRAAGDVEAMHQQAPSPLHLALSGRPS